MCVFFSCYYCVKADPYLPADQGHLRCYCSDSFPCLLSLGTMSLMCPDKHLQVVFSGILAVTRDKCAPLQQSEPPTLQNPKLQGQSIY